MPMIPKKNAQFEGSECWDATPERNGLKGFHSATALKTAHCLECILLPIRVLLRQCRHAWIYLV